MRTLTATELKAALERSGLLTSIGNIKITLNGTIVQIKATDTIGNSLQEWLTKWMLENNIYHRVPVNTQKFPDLFLSEDDQTNLLEVKSYVARRTPAFDIANFNSYWRSLADHPYRLDADYLVFAYQLTNGELSVRQIFLKKVWEITGRATDFDLKCQRKQGTIYNIRPISFNSATRALHPFTSKEEFIAALYKTLLSVNQRPATSRQWLTSVLTGYERFSGQNLTTQVERYIRN